MRLSPGKAFAVCCFCIAALTLGAQGNPGGSAALEALNATEPVTFSGTLNSSLGGAVGWASNPLKGGLGGTSIVEGFAVSNTLAFDARPDPSFRVHGSILSSYPADSFIVSELFFDYSVGDSVFLRGGKQAISWGNGRVFGVGDLMATPVIDAAFNVTAADIAFKAYVPFGSNGLTLVALSPGIGSSGQSDTSFAGRLDLAFGRFDLAEEAIVLQTKTVNFSSYAKTSLAGIDIFAQAFGAIGNWSETTSTLSALAGAYWESTAPRVKLYAEYWYAGDSAFANDHRFAIGIGWTVDESAAIKLGLLWTHALADNSGSILPTVVYQPRSYITVSLAPIITYGSTGSVYASALPPGYTSPIVWSEKYSLILRADLALDY